MIVREKINRADGSIKYREYLKQNRLGKGGFAECYEVERLGDKKKFALKIIPKKLLEKPKARQKMVSEIKLHRAAKHKNICDLIRAFEDEGHVYMLLELCSNGNMFDMIRRRKRLTIPETQYFIYQLIDSLCYLHNRQLIHRDVKLGNLLIDADMNLKLADFGLTTKIQFPGDRKHTVCGTPNYIAPEIIRASMGLGASGHSYEVDVWSTGIIMYLMLIGKAPFQTTMVEKTYQKIAKGQFQFPDFFKDECAKDLIRKILVVDPSKRFTFDEILNHQFMNPKCGIPKQLPQICYSQAPKFGVFEKYAQDQVKQSARNASIMTLRSSIDLSMNQELAVSTMDKTGQEKGSSKDVKGLLKSVFSTSSISSSLKKLTELGRSSSSSQNKTIQPRMNRSNSSLNKSTSRDRISTMFRPQSSMISKESKIEEDLPFKQELKFVYVLNYKKEVVWSYVMNNGYIGTYEPTYKLLYNRQSKLYFEVDEKHGMKKFKMGEEITNQNIVNRKKFIKNYKDSGVICEPFVNLQRLVYILKIFKPKDDSIYLFKLSNGDIQAHNYEKNHHLLISGENILFFEVENGQQMNTILQKKSNYAQCPKKVLDLYLITKKVLVKINASRNNPH